MTEQELNLWEQENSFKSYRSVLVDADREWAEIDSEDKEPAFLAKFQDVLSVVDGELIPHIKVFMYQAIINREGIYRTGNHYHKVVGDFIISVIKEDYQNLNEIRIVNEKPLESDGLKILKYTGGEGKDLKNDRTQATCLVGDPRYRGAEYYLDPSGCKNDRKATIQAISYFSLFVGYGDFNGTSRYGDYYTAKVDIRVFGTSRNWLCSWKGYSTQLEFRSVKFSVYNGHKTTGYTANSTIHTYQNYNDIVVPNNNSIVDMSEFIITTIIGDVQFNNSIVAPTFGSIYAEGKSRGIGDNWAIIFCPI